MNILLVYPHYPDTFWSFRYALKLISKKAAYPPLGLLTVASMLPAEWKKKLVDMNVTNLTDDHLRWADYVFISGMVVQRDSAKEVIARCNRLSKKVVAGGPLFTTGYDEFSGVDHFVLGEGEVTIPQFITDIKAGCPKPMYLTDEHPDITHTPVPMWSLIDSNKYSALNIQYSRGCPFNCEFCDIIVLNGRGSRTKSKDQIINELQSIYVTGWRNSVFIVDDNFIGNKLKLKNEILPAITEWMKNHNYPYTFQTEASINLADDEELMKMMVEAGFNKVFIGIETPNEESLVECAKSQNTKRDLVTSVKTIQNRGMEVMGGFIVGFDSDPVSIFKNQISFIQKSGIVTAMVGLLNAPPGTRLYQRLKQENRLLRSFSGNNTDCSINFIPKMDYHTLVRGYKHVVNTIYSPREYYERLWTFLKEYRPKNKQPIRVHTYHILGLFSSVWFLGLVEKGRWHFWKLFFKTLFRKPQAMSLSIGLTVYGYHFRKVVKNLVVPARLESDDYRA